MQAGIFAKTFPGSDPDAVLAQLRGAGFTAAQFNLSCAGLDPVPDRVPAGVAAALHAAAQAHGLDLSALSGTCNLAHPDAPVRQSGIAALLGVIDFAAEAGIGMVTLCTGSRNRDDMWAPHPDNATAAAWSDMRDSIAQLVPHAQLRGVFLGIEPEQANVVRTVADTLRLADELRTDRLRIVFDPANLFEAAPTDTVRAIVARELDQAVPLLGLVHVKDRSESGTVVPPGDGAVDFPDLFARLGDIGYTGAVVTHGISLAEVPQTARRMRDWLS
ncbi:MAG TPA: sugar phosphate isomerase/epimerase family protein [Paenirhodobacter sp.]